MFRIYGFGFFTTFLVIIPVIIPYYESLGLSMTEIFTVQAMFGLSTALFEVPSGYLCDLWGRKKTMILGGFFYGASFAWFCFIDHFWELVAFEMVLGFGVSLFSGSDLSYLYDTYREKHSDRTEITRALAHLQLAKMSGETIAAVLGGIVVAYSFQHVIYTHAVFAWMPFVFAITLQEPSYEKMSRVAHWENTKEIFFHVFRSNRLLRLSFIVSVVWGLASFYAVWIFQKLWNEAGIPLTSFGWIWASYTLTVGLSGMLTHRLERAWGPIPVILVMSIAPLIGYFGLGFFDGMAGIIFGFLHQICRGLNAVIIKDAINWRTPSRFRATVNSLSALFFRLIFFVTGPIVGYCVDQYGMKASFFGLGLAYLVIFFFTIVPLIVEIKSEKIQFEKSLS